LIPSHVNSHLDHAAIVTKHHQVITSRLSICIEETNKDVKDKSGFMTKYRMRNHLVCASR